MGHNKHIGIMYASATKTGFRFQNQISGSSSDIRVNCGNWFQTWIFDLNPKILKTFVKTTEY